MITDNPKEQKRNEKEIWVLGEADQSGILLPASLEILSEGSRLSSKSGNRLCGVLIGTEASETNINIMASYGASKIYSIKNPQLDGYDCAIYAEIVSKIVSHYSPCLLIASATPNGSDFIPRVAARIQAAFVTNCTLLNYDKDGSLLCTKSIYSGKFSAVIKAPEKLIKIVTMRPGVIDPVKSKQSLHPVIIELPVEISQGNVKRAGFIPGDPKTVDLTEAEIIVAGGRGVKNIEGWRLIEGLAEALHAAVGGSRAAVDEGLIGFNKQIGQTGKTINPNLYIACGISGSIYHTSAISSSKTIIAINIDPTAEIFEVADISIKADLHELIPILIDKIKYHAQSTKQKPL